MADKIIDVKITQRTDTESNWKSKNPVLLKNEHAYTSGTGKYKIGDGTKKWSELIYYEALNTVDKTKLDGIAEGANKTVVDSTLSDTSTNPVQNKVVNTALAGKSNTNHTHDLSAMINTLGTGTSTPTDNDYYVSQYVGGGTTTTSYHRRPMSALWNYIKGKLATVATSGSYNDLSNKPKIPTVGNGTVTIKQAGTTKGTFTMNQSGATTVELTDNNTWRGVQDNLTSSATDQSLSAKQGKVLNEKIDAVQVGGRNLLKGSHATAVNYSYPSSSCKDWCTFTTTVPLNGSTYTLSFWAKSTVADDKIRVHFYNPSNITSVKGSQGQTGTATDGLCDFILTTTLTKYWVTYTIPAGGGSTRTVIIPRIYAASGTGTITIQWEKVEEGDKATAWTPAPEDVDAKISNTAAKYLPLTGGTLTGGLSIKGNAGDKPLRVRGIAGWDGTNDGPLYLQYNVNQPVVFGNTGTYNISSDGGTYSGTSAQTRSLKLLSSTRAASANYDLTSSTYQGKVTYSLATSTMTTGKPPVDAHMLTFGWDSSGWGAQLAIGNRANNHLYVRGSNSVTADGKVSSVWDDSWRTVLDSNNYNSYAPTKTGGGASGTWGISVTGNAATATKLAAARTVSGGTDITLSFNYDGSANSAATIGYYSCKSILGNKNNYPYHRFAKLDKIVTSYTDKSTTLYISQDYYGGGFGIAILLLRTNNTSQVSTAEIRWLVRSGLPADCLQIGLYNVYGQTYADAFFKHTGTYSNTIIRAIASGSRGTINRTWVLNDSEEVYNTTDTDKLTSTEVYTSINEAATKLHGQEYISTIIAKDSGSVNQANQVDWSGVQNQPNYAGSSSKGGSANSAVKLDSSAGSALQPIYFSSGKPTACTYSLAKSVPSDAKFTDTIYTHPAYTAKANGMYKISVDNKGHVNVANVVTKADITGLGISGSEHTHDDRYYTESEMNAKLDGKSNTNHKHSSIKDVNDSKDISFAYSKSGMNYADCTWIAAWNGYELRAINKSHFAAAGHTHDSRYYTEDEVNTKLNSYLPLSGGTLTGLLTATGGVQLTNGGTWWLGGKTVTDCIVGTKHNADSYYPVIRVDGYSGHVANFGGIGDKIGFYGYKADRTVNGNDWYTEWDMSTGNLSTSGTFYAGNVIETGGEYSSRKDSLYWRFGAGAGTGDSNKFGFWHSSKGTMAWISSDGEVCANKFSAGYTPPYGNSFGCSNWFRSSGNTGWFNATYGGGIYMIDSSWVRTYGDKNFYCSQTIAGQKGVQAYAMDDGGAHFRAVNGDYGFMIRNDGSNSWFLITASGSPYGTWNKTPVHIENSTGKFYVDSNAYMADLYSKDLSGDGTWRRPINSAGGSGNQIGYISSRSSNIGVVAQWGGASFSVKQINVSSSDIRLKANISSTTTQALPLINQIKMRQFTWKDTGERQKIGVVADELELLDPRLVEGGGYDEEGRMNVKCINTFYLTGYLTKGIQELSLENTQLKQENKEIKAQLKQLQNAVQEAYVQIGKLQKQGGN